MSGQNLPQGAEQVLPVEQPAQPQEPVSPRSQDQWDKLLESNRSLNDKLKQALDAQTQARVQPQPQQYAPTYQPQAPLQDFVDTDPNTGERFINEQRLAQRMSELEQQARKADVVDQKFQNYLSLTQEQQAERELGEAVREYPELDSKDSARYNRNFHSQVRAVITDSMMNPQDYDELSRGFGRLTVAQAAQRIRSAYPQQPAPTPTPDAQPDAAETAKAQASAMLSNTPQQTYSTQGDAELENLRSKTRYGDDTALAMRLQHTEHISPAYGYGVKK